MSKEKFTKSLIKSLEEKELYSVAKAYLKELEDIDNIFTLNGPWDSGIDLSTASFDIQVQATVEEKNFETKLFSDLNKAKQNIDKFSITNRVKYFYSYSLSNTTKLQYKSRAKIDYGIILDIIDCNVLSEASKAYPELGRQIFDYSEISKYSEESTYFDDVRVKSYYDLMSFGNSIDIKFNIIKSYTINILFNCEFIQKNLLLSQVNQYFTSSLDSNYFDTVLARLSTDHKIKLKGGDISLHAKERQRVEDALNEFQEEEALLLSDLTTALKKYNLQEHLDDIVIRLSELYESTYSLNVSEITHRDSNINDIRSATERLRNYLASIIASDTAPTDLEDLLKTLIKVGDSSDILPKIAAGHVYCKISDPDRLERYAMQYSNNRTIFLDTNVMLNLLLIDYAPKVEYDNYYHKIAKQFYHFSADNDLYLKTIYPYSLELVNIFEDALGLVPFTKLPVFKTLGNSSNPIFQYYTFLSDNDELENELTFEDFLKEFNFYQKSKVDHKRNMSYLLNTINIEIQEVKKYDLEVVIDLIKDDLRLNGKLKSNFAANNDAIMFELLSDTDLEVNPKDPILCSWDLSLNRVRKQYFESNPRSTKWFLYTPTRLMDHISMINFQIRPEVVSNEILSILDQDNTFQQMTHTLLDAVATIINPDNEVGRKYTNLLAEMRKNEILEVNAKVPELPADHSPDALTIDIIFKSLFTKYFVSTDNTSHDFKVLFTKDEYFEEISSMLVDEKKYVSTNYKVSESMTKRLDEILKNINHELGS
ncbi:hypothetical protein ACLCDV_13120 [Sphingobacterium sp. Lzh-3]|uniref:hypothetical protein n=1 Tax=Sphingobacterium sp. Lzh-3 TaxID=3382150 RepID=UPI00398D2005